MGAAWLVGVAINLVGSVLINLGTNIMKLGHNKRAALNRTESPSSATPVRKIREWQIGVALFSVGNVANFVSFGYAAQSLLSAIGCIQFVSNVFFASFVLKEQVSFQVIVAISCIVGGCIILVSFGSHTSKVYTYRDLLRLYGQPAYVCYMSLGGAAVALAYTGYWKGQKAVEAKGAGAAQLWVAVLPILYCIFSAIIGTQSVLFSKTLAVLLRATFSGDNQLGKWFTWLVLPAFLFSAAFWVTRLNKGLQMFPAMIVVPTLQICWTLFSILSGMLYFQEYEDMRALHAAMFALGVSVVFVGVFLLTKASAPKGQGTDGYLTVELNKAKIAYVHHADDEVDLHSTEAAETTGLIGTKVAKERSLQSENLQGAAPGQSNTLRGAASLNPKLHAELNLADDADLNMHGEDEQPLVGTTTSSTSVDASSVNQGSKHTSKRNFSLSKAFSGGVGLQRAWAGGGKEPGSGGGSDSRQGGGELSGRGAQVLPDFAGAGDEGAAEATSMQRQHQRRRFKHNVSILSRIVAKDFNLDETAAARLTLGLGDSAMPGVSLFAMPMIDLRSAASVAPTAVGRQDRKYGVEADRSQGGAIVHTQDGPLLSKPDNPSSAVYDSDEQLGASQAAAIKKLHKEQQMVGLDSPRGINPLANAIDVRSATGSKLGRQVSMDSLLTSVKQNFGRIHANIRDLTSNIQAGSAGRNYARMRSKDEVDTGAASAGQSRRESMQ